MRRLSFYWNLILIRLESHLLWKHSQYDGYGLCQETQHLKGRKFHCTRRKARGVRAVEVALNCFALWFSYMPPAFRDGVCQEFSPGVFQSHVL